MMRTFPAADLSAARAYSLMVGIVVPRPVAWITTINAGGMVNAAPFSCYTFVCNQPPMLAVSIGPRGEPGAQISSTCRAHIGEMQIVASTLRRQNLPFSHRSIR